MDEREAWMRKNYPSSNLYYYEKLNKHQEEIGELWGAHAYCWHELEDKSGGGVECIHCGGWFCF